MPGEPTTLRIESFGVTAAISVGDPALVEPVRATLPPGWSAAPAADPAVRVALLHEDDRSYAVAVDDDPPVAAEDAEHAIDLLDAKVRLAVAELAPEHVFIHAGVVGVDGRALVVPGRSFTGKTTLVAALLRAGATYYSDEYAVLDADGLVHPYAKPLSVRPDGAQRTPRNRTDEVDPRSLGASAGTEPIPVRLIACAPYREGERWAPDAIRPGDAALILLGNAVAAQSAPDRVLAHVRNAVRGCGALEGTRGDAGETATLLLDALRAQPEPTGELGAAGHSG